MRILGLGLICLSVAVGQTTVTLPPLITPDIWEELSPPGGGRAGSGSRGAARIPNRYSVDRYSYFDQLFMAYKLIIEPTESPDEVFVTFLPSDRTPEALAAEMAPRMVPAIDPKSFVYLPLAEYPAKKRLRWKEQFNVDSGSHDGRHITVHLELFREPLAAQEQMDRLRARSQARLSGMFSSAGALPVGSSLPPKADFQGEPRDFTADDFELSLMAPVATLNGKQYPASGQASGSIVWIYVPEHGRFILSLAPHPELGFKLAGKFQASSFRLTVDAGQLDIVAARTQFSSTSVFNVYVLLDPGYVPTSSRDVGRAVAGSVSLKELQLLRESPGK